MDERRIETPRERFRRLATARTNTALKKLEILGNCSNKQVYEYNDADIDKIFTALTKKLRETKERFMGQKKEGFQL